MAQVKSLEERFWEKVDIREKHECWEWKACLDTKGYGQITVGKGHKISSRLAYELTYGEIPSKDLFVLHKCDNRKCCNPNHLFVGTAKENSEDMVRKGRSTKGKISHCGEKTNTSKLTASDVVRIRNLYDSGSCNQSQLAEKYNVKQQTIWCIVNRNSWKHIP